MRLIGTRVVFLVAPEFEDLEFWVPLMRLQEEGAETVVAGMAAGEVYQGKHGLTVRTHIGFDDVHPVDFRGIVIPGGWAPDKLRRFESVRTLLREFDQQHKTIAMICHAGLVGISAGIVKGHFATGSEGIKDDLINAEAIWRDEPAFRSGHLVWGRVVADIPAFCRELVAALREHS